MKIAVAGATGRAGRHVVDVLAARGHDVVPMARSTGVDVITGEGLAEALNGAECIVDLATGPSPDEEAATAFFTTAARNLQQAGHEAGVQRIILVSIVGIDRTVIPGVRISRSRKVMPCCFLPLASVRTSANIQSACCA